MEMVNLRADYLTQPLGVDRPPVFSWELTGETEGRFQIVVALDEDFEQVVWKSGPLEGNKSFGHKYGGMLRPKTRYYWRVELAGEGGGQRSPSSWFETGLLGEEDWEADWIGAGETCDPLFRRAFSVLKAPVRARAYLCGLGYYELTLNGKKVGDRLFDPAWTAYEPLMGRKMLYPLHDETSCRCLYVVHDVTPLLCQGENVVGVELGNGWYHQPDKTVEGEFDYGSPKLRLRLELSFSDGSVQTVCSDESFRFHAGPITYNNVYFGEKYDARLELAGWNTPGFDDSAWEQAKKTAAPAGKLLAQLAPPDRVSETLAPLKLREQNGRTVYDIGKNVAGVVRLYARGKAGETVKLHFAEELSQDGGLDTSTIWMDCQWIEYTLKGEELECYQNKFFWFGGRYIEAEGPLESVEVLTVHADLAQTGGLFCSNDTLNRLFRIYVNTQLSNLHGAVPSDCPHRERLGYTGDGQITAETVMMLFDAPAFYRKWMDDIADCQCKKSGHVQHTAPFYGGGGGPGGWGSAMVILPYLMYLYYGDRRVVEENFEGMCRWMQYLERHSEGHIVVSEEKDGWCLGDWVCAGKTELPEPLVNTYYYGKCAEMMGKLSALLGKTQLAERYMALLKEIRQAFHRSFYRPETGEYWEGRQGANAFALDLGVPPPELTEAVTQKLIDSVQNSGHFDTGIFGTPVLLQALADAGRADLGLRLLTAEGYPGYKWMLDCGATSIWETWEGKESHDHPMFGSVVGWLIRTYGGLNLVFDGKLHIAPVLDGELDFCHAHLHTMYGTAVCEYRITEGRRAEVTVQVPWGAAAELVLPGEKRTLTGGRYRFDVSF